MKNFAPLFIAVAGIYSFSGFAQRNDPAGVNAKMNDLQLMADETTDKDLIASYHVQETINMTFGGSVTTYDVSKFSLVGTNDLGKNNTRVVTSKYTRAKLAQPTAEVTPEAKAEVKIDNPRVPIEALSLPKPVSVDIMHKVSGQKYVYVDILDTYERILEKGYTSEDMLRRVANGRFFDGNLKISAKWYTKLFAIATNLDPVYYYRYAESLKAIGQMDKAREMMMLFEKSKNL